MKKVRGSRMETGGNEEGKRAEEEEVGEAL